MSLKNLLLMMMVMTMMMMMTFSACRDRVQSVLFCHASKQLLSAGDDSMLVCWAMDVERLPVILESFIVFCRDTSVD